MATFRKGDIRQGLPRTAGEKAWPSRERKGAVQNENDRIGTRASETPIRRGLPRVLGGELWPSAGLAPMSSPGGSETLVPDSTVRGGYAQTLHNEPAQEVEQEHARRISSKAQTSLPAPIEMLPDRGRARIMVRGRQLTHWIRVVVLGGLGTVVAAAIVVLAARGVTTLKFVPDWLERYPGEYAPVVLADSGFPWWLSWTHFFNLFLMVLIIRSGLLVRIQQKPPAYWSSRKRDQKISINLWLHTSLDVLWMLNGCIFVVLLFVSGHWARIVPTSWEVFPNALSALLQYLTLDWPTEHSWVNYNSLQQLMYFMVVFVVAPVAIITGVRMSAWWPKDSVELNTLFPAALARAVHFPTMLFFVFFIILHVFLVFATGALRNLNHMFAGTNAVNWTGFWLFVLAIALTVGGWIACKPLLLGPVAVRFGKVTNR